MTSIAPFTSATPTPAPTGGSDADRLHQAAQAFEAIFTRQMLASARQTNFGDELWGKDQGGDTFTAMRDERFADLAAKSGTLGLARQVEAALKPMLGSAKP